MTKLNEDLTYSFEKGEDSAEDADICPSHGKPTLIDSHKMSHPDLMSRV